MGMRETKATSGPQSDPLLPSRKAQSKLSRVAETGSESKLQLGKTPTRNQALSRGLSVAVNLGRRGLGSMKGSGCQPTALPTWPLWADVHGSFRFPQPHLLSSVQKASVVCLCPSQTDCTPCLKGTVMKVSYLLFFLFSPLLFLFGN